MLVLENVLIKQGLRQLPVSDFGGLRSLLLCESCRDILKAVITSVIRKKEELAAEDEATRDRNLTRARSKLVVVGGDDTARASESVELGAADRPPGEVDPGVRPADPEM